MTPLRIASLHVYPLKSAAGIAVEAWPVDDFGLAGDRRWAVVDADGVCLTQRTHPRLARVRTALCDGRLRLEAPARPPIELSAADGAGEPVTIWDDQVAAVDLGAEAAAWVSAVLDAPCRVVYMPAGTRRPVERHPPEAARVGFADAYPFLVLGAASLGDLNRRLRVPLPLDRFRPNLVVDGGAPFAEDGWRRIRAGAIELSLPKPCARCVVTTVDQTRGAKDGPEPLRTLATFRRVGGEVRFGMNAVHHGTGRLAVGNAVEVLESAADA